VHDVEWRGLEHRCPLGRQKKGETVAVSPHLSLDLRDCGGRATRRCPFGGPAHSAGRSPDWLLPPAQSVVPERFSGVTPSAAARRISSRSLLRGKRRLPAGA
jgi:hypothetical protein